jgi:hypothetical protein
MAEIEAQLEPEAFRRVRSGELRAAWPLRPGDRVLYREVGDDGYTGRWLVSEVEIGDHMIPPQPRLAWPPAASHDVPEPR